METLVSVVVPVYNIAPYIDECVSSICSQTYSDLEIILVDDGSTDESGEICSKWALKDKRIQVIHQSNQGVVTARKNGILSATGEYITFIDGDDWIEADMFEYMVTNIGNADMISTGVYVGCYPDSEKVNYDRFDEGVYSRGDRMDGILKKMMYNPEDGSVNAMTSWMWNKMYRRDLVLETYPGVDAKMKFAEDLAFNLMFLLKCQSIVIKHGCFYHYRYRGESAAHGKNYYRLEELSRVYNLVRPILETVDKKYDLMYQFQKWVLFEICFSVNELLGFDQRIYLPRYFLESSQLCEKKIVLYGAGVVGQDCFRQLSLLGANIVCWVDKGYERFQDTKYKICSPETILQIDFDIVLICIEGREIQTQVKEELVASGVDENKIHCSNTYRVF